MNSKLFIASFLAIGLSATTALSATTKEKIYKLPTINIYATKPNSVSSERIDLKENYTIKPIANSVDYLKNLTGITASRMGGHGLEPTIRGQSQNQLNIISDETFTHGGCPNRMDPPTAYSSVESYDSVTVVRGYQSVLNGAGGAGGSIILDRKKPQLAKDVQVTSDVTSGFDGNSGMDYYNTNALAGNDFAYARGAASYKNSGNYKDGDGNTVRSSFVEKSGNLILGFTPQDAHIYFGVEQNKIEDSLFAGSSMDSPISDGKTYRAGIEKEFENGALSKIDLSAYASLVEHLMDNYSLRAATGMRMRADSESDTYGAKLKTDFNFSDELVKTVLEYKSNNRDATRKQGMTPTTVTNLQSILWPDITTEEMSVALETTKDINYNNRLTIGARYDYVVADFGKANQISSVTSLSANNLYNTYYGYTASEQKENNFGGLARIEHDLTNDVMLYSGLSRSVRTADATERGMASYSGMGGSQSWVGNPRIEPEKHHQLDAGFRYTQSSWNVDISAYANKVSDYILKDSARGQSGILVNSPNVTVYRNVDALLSGFELSGSWDISSSLSLNSNAVYTYGENESDNSVLAQIPALQGSIGAEWRVEDYLKFGSDVRWAAKQTRVDTNRLTGSGRDVAKTGGYAVLDLNATLTKLKPVELTFGINNLFDTKYADHLNRSSISDPTEIQVNEVGRSLFVQGKVRF